MALGDTLHIIFVNFLLVLTLMVGTFCFYLVNRIGALLDIAWAAGFIVTSITSFALCDGYIMRRLLLILLVWLWSIRLCAHFFKRFQRKEEDGRFQILKTWLGADSTIKFGAVFLLQAVLVVVLSWPFIVIGSNRSPCFSSLEVSSLFIFLVSFCCEIISDLQLQNFKENPENQGKVCDVGIWRCSRHPNYFFEFMIWVSFFIFSLDAPFGFTAVISPIIMWYFFHYMMKQNEEDWVLKKGELYKEYQKKTSSFFPWFPM